MKKKTHELICMADVPPQTEDQKHRAEMAYRRGYAQGFWSCLDCFERGKSLAAISRLYDRIYAWRCRHRDSARKHVEKLYYQHPCEVLKDFEQNKKDRNWFPPEL
jgi:hypothetical protein